MSYWISFNINTVNIIKRKPLSGLPVYIIARIFFCSLVFLFAGCSTPKPSTAAALNDSSPASQIIHLYQGPLNHLDSVRNGGCPMYPNCSAYGISAIEKHGPLVGWMMTFDRLMRCGLDETGLSPEVLVKGDWKYIDTLENNDFWWCPANDDTGLINSHPSEQSLIWETSVE
jgi:putative component of membrane protein insertase Oxa1/YidC/SpoIIIJ protein YidD